MMHLTKYKDVTVSSTEQPYQSGRSLTPQLELMRNNRKSKSGSDLGREPFTTIDDLAHKAEELASGLRNLGEHKHPLDIRRGIKKGKEVSDMAEKDESRTIKAGSKTYFFDLKETKEGKPFLVITESRFKGEGKERERASVLVFPESAEEFSQAVGEMTKKLN